MKKLAEEIQADYYQKTAYDYDAVHLVLGDEEHNLSLSFLSSIINLYSIRSILDVGAGTGRTIDYIMKNHPQVKIVGIEPVKELLEQGYNKEIPRSVLIEGDGNNINYQDGEFDLVCEFAVLHHVPNPSRVISEMLRVANKCIFISDCNAFGQGSLLKRSIKQVMNFFGLWRLYNLLVTKGKGYHISEGDGLFYSYSVFDSYKQIRKQCRKVHLLNTTDSNVNLYKSSAHVALLGIK